MPCIASHFKWGCVLTKLNTEVRHCGDNNGFWLFTFCTAPAQRKDHINRTKNITDESITY